MFPDAVPPIIDWPPEIPVERFTVKVPEVFVKPVEIVYEPPPEAFIVTSPVPASVPV